MTHVRQWIFDVSACNASGQLHSSRTHVPPREWSQAFSRAVYKNGEVESERPSYNSKMQFFSCVPSFPGRSPLDCGDDPSAFASIHARTVRLVP